MFQPESPRVILHVKPDNDFTKIHRYRDMKYESLRISADKKLFVLVDFLTFSWIFVIKFGL